MAPCAASTAVHTVVNQLQTFLVANTNQFSSNFIDLRIDWLFLWPHWHNSTCEQVTQLRNVLKQGNPAITLPGTCGQHIGQSIPLLQQLVLNAAQGVVI